ncbi:hypothetical protein BDQ12DRAFT_664666 [Crucibulum laeve]|uniref:Uncharacterized protein n=1 Tax=Crucibulum laeve TaxID=68775 RepID=A0A5C3M414_9AGAR|nr:hypothetical protein BDQ12DRAFT_664666 [Crucibulum laeve]
MTSINRDIPVTTGDALPSSNKSSPTLLPDPKATISQEPADKWATQTLNALSPPATHQQNTAMHHDFASAVGNDGIASNVTTPGPDFPGAYPGTHPKPEAVAADVEKAKDLLAESAGTAQVTLSEAAEQAKVQAAGLMTTVGGYVENAAGYLPESVRGYMPIGNNNTNTTTQNSLPSSETSQNYHPSSSGGAGTLPGPPGEQGVATLPDERLAPGHTSEDVTAAAAHTTPTNLAGGVGDLPGSSTETGVAKLPEERRQEGLPSHDMTGLPGKKDETGVAKMPEEKQKERDDAHGVLRDAIQSTSAPDAPYLSSSTTSAGTGAAAFNTTDGASSTASTRTLAGSKYAPSSTTLGAAAVGAGVGAGATSVGHGTDETHDSTNATTGHSSNTGSGMAGKAMQLEKDVEAKIPGTEEHKAQKSEPQDMKDSREKAKMPSEGVPAQGIKSSHTGIDSNKDLPNAPNTTGRAHELGNPDSQWKGQAMSPQSDRATAGHGSMRAFDSDRAEHGHTLGKENETTSTGPAGERLAMAAAGDKTGAYDSHSTVTGSGADISPKGSSTKIVDDGRTSSDSKSSSGLSRKKTPSPRRVGADGAHKPGFMDKLKGEVKVISGKLGHNEQKVEEGKKMMGKN